MEVALERTVRAAHQEQGAPAVVVQVGVSHRRAPHDGSLVQQRSVALHGVLHLLEEVRHLTQAVGVDDVKFSDGAGDVAVMRCPVERLVGPAVREDTVLQIESGLERDRPREVRLESEHLEVEHQPHVVLPAVGDARWCLRHLPLLAAVVLRLDQPDPALQLADVRGVLVQGLAVDNSQLPLQIGQPARDKVEQAPVGP